MATSRNFYVAKIIVGLQAATIQHFEPFLLALVGHWLPLATSNYNQAMGRVSLICRRIAAIVLCLPALSVARSPQDDSKLQSAIAQTMSGQRGTAVVLDVNNGRVLAAYHADVAARRVARPGSSIKPFTLLALLQTGNVDAHTLLVCKRPLTIAGHKLDCTHPDVPEPLGPAAALAYSCNSYFTNVAKRLTAEQLWDTFGRAGFGSVTRLQPNEASGSIALAQSPEQLQLQAIGEWGVS